MPAYSPLVILMFSLIFYGSFASVGYAFTAAGRPDISYKINGIAIFINFFLNLNLIPVLGLVGAAIATSTTFILRATINVLYLQKIFNINLNSKWFYYAMGTIAFMITIFFILRIWINPLIIKSIVIAIFLVFINH